MAKKAVKHLLITSTERYSGKSATVLGLIHKLLNRGIKISYGKPVETCLQEVCTNVVEKDGDFLSRNLEFASLQVKQPLLALDSETIAQRLSGEDGVNYSQALKEYVEELEGEVIVIEGASNLWEGSLFGLSANDIAGSIDASILLVCRYDSLFSVANILSAKSFLGDRLLGALINNIPPSKLEEVANSVKPYLEKQSIPVLGMIPQDRLLYSVSVGELATRLDAKVLCCDSRLNLMVESLSIGAMNVNSALEYFRQRNNMAVVTGADRTELQMAALETSTNCLIVTGHIDPSPLILSRAEDLEVPVLSVDSDTLTTVEIVDSAFGKVPIRESIKAQRIKYLMEKYFDFDRLIKYLDLESEVRA